MKRRPILRSTQYPRTVRSRRYYEDLAQMDYEAGVKRARQLEANKTEDLGADQPAPTPTTTNEE